MSCNCLPKDNKENKELIVVYNINYTVVTTTHTQINYMQTPNQVAPMMMAPSPQIAPQPVENKPAEVP